MDTSAHAHTLAHLPQADFIYMHMVVHNFPVLIYFFAVAKTIKKQLLILSAHKILGTKISNIFCK